ncbi:MAG: ABC transporter ATP-binding protein [Methanoregulaceae archaeon]|jgi:tungstate transport system ATP-binding protein
MIRITGLSHQFGRREVIHGIDLEIRNGEIFTLIGPSGSGKTTLLRLINLLDRPTKGSITFDGMLTDGHENERRSIRRSMAMVFQKPAVLNTSVEQNVSFGLEFRRVPRDQIQMRVASALEMVGLSNFSRRKAVTLSGGEMQRVAIARALVLNPEVLLLDEPTANLDPLSTEIIEDLIVKINRDKKTTVIIATHDMSQGQRLANRMGVMMSGQLVQVGNLIEIFYHPVNRAIAVFVGIDPIRESVVESNDNNLATIAVRDVRIQAVTNISPGQQVTLCIRPEEVTLSLPDTCPTTSSARNCLPGTITHLLPYGPFTRVKVDCGVSITALITRQSSDDLHLSPGKQVMATIKATAVHVIPDR